MTGWVELLQDPNMLWILMGSMLLGAGSGVLGSFTYLRKQSLMGDALAHAALPGVCIAFMLTETKSVLYFMIGAVVAGIAATFGIGWITRYSRIKQDAALGIILSLFFGLGIVLLTQIQHGSSGNQSGLDKFLFGQAASMVSRDVWTMGIISAALIGCCLLLFKEFKVLSFDPAFAKGLGYPVAFLEQLLMLLVVIAVVAGIQTVGVVLMAAFLIIPSVTARYWTERLSVMVVLAGLFGALSGAAGTFFSAAANRLPTGPMAVLAASTLFVASLMLSPRGLVAKGLRRMSARRSIGAEGPGGEALFLPPQEEEMV